MLHYLSFSLLCCIALRNSYSFPHITVTSLSSWESFDTRSYCVSKPLNHSSIAYLFSASSYPRWLSLFFLEDLNVQMSSHSNMHTLDIHSATTEEILSLENIRSVLIRLEETICFQLIERAQFARNAKCYLPGGFPQLKEREGWNSSWLAWFLKETESVHAKARRFEAPDEYPFTDPKLLPKPILEPVIYPELLWKHSVNVNDQILKFYVDSIVPEITKTLGEVGSYRNSSSS